jgi:hypothetical protein
LLSNAIDTEDNRPSVHPETGRDQAFCFLTGLRSFAPEPYFNLIDMEKPLLISQAPDEIFLGGKRLND